MKSAIAVCVVIALVGVQGHSIQLSPAQKEKAIQNKQECIKETGVKEELIDEAKKGNIVEDEGLKKFTLCFFQKAGILDAEGKLNIDTALEKLPEGIDKTEAKNVLESCKDKTGKDAAEIAFEIVKCYKQGMKAHMKFLD